MPSPEAILAVDEPAAETDRGLRLGAHADLDGDFLSGLRRKVGPEMKRLHAEDLVAESVDPEDETEVIVALDQHGGFVGHRDPESLLATEVGEDEADLARGGFLRIRKFRAEDRAPVAPQGVERVADGGGRRRGREEREGGVDFHGREESPMSLIAMGVPSRMERLAAAPMRQDRAPAREEAIWPRGSGHGPLKSIS